MLLRYFDWRSSMNSGRFAGDPSQETCPEVLHEALAGSHRERSLKLVETEPARGSQHRLGVMHQSANGFAELERSRRCNQTPTRPHRQRIAGCLAQSRQGTAHRRRAEVQSSGSARNIAFRKQDIEREEQIGIRSGQGIAPRQRAEPGAGRGVPPLRQAPRKPSCRRPLAVDWHFPACVSSQPTLFSRSWLRQ